jgi:AcrR family transcriptional regulator
VSSPDEQRSTVGGKRDRTRAALIAATLAVVADKGFAGASLDEIAARAGMTKGAIYSNFSGKAELLLAAVSARGLTLAPTAPLDGSMAEHLEAMSGALAAMIGRARGEAAFLAEFQLYALADPELRRGVAAFYADAFTQTAAYFAQRERNRLGMAPRNLAVALQSIALGFMVQSFITPEEVTDDVIRATLRALADGLARAGDRLDRKGRRGWRPALSIERARD